MLYLETFHFSKYLLFTAYTQNVESFLYSKYRTRANANELFGPLASPITYETKCQHFIKLYDIIEYNNNVYIHEAQYKKTTPKKFKIKKSRNRSRFVNKFTTCGKKERSLHAYARALAIFNTVLYSNKTIFNYIFNIQLNYLLNPKIQLLINKKIKLVFNLNQTIIEKKKELSLFDFISSKKFDTLDKIEKKFLLENLENKNDLIKLGKERELQKLRILAKHKLIGDSKIIQNLQMWQNLKMINYWQDLLTIYAENTEMVFHQQSIYSPVFAFIITRTSKAIYKSTRRKSGRYSVKLTYIKYDKCLSFMFRQCKYSFLFSKGATFLGKYMSTLFTALIRPDKSLGVYIGKRTYLRKN